MTTTTDTTASVTRAGAPHRDDVVRALSAAFADDPVFGWILPHPDDRLPALPPTFAAFVDAFARHDATDAALVGGDVAGAALWVPPGVEAVHPDDAGALDAALALLPDPAQHRLAQCMEVFATLHPHEPHWYLNFLGIDPAHQGRGLGSALLGSVLEVADAWHQPAYLEATSPRNRALYERHGFRCIGDLVMPGGPTAFAMWREPQGCAGPVR